MREPTWPSLNTDWAKPFAHARLNDDLDLFIFALKYTQWGDSYYPVFVSKSPTTARAHQPSKLSEAVGDGRFWRGKPLAIYVSYGGDTLIDVANEEDRPFGPIYVAKRFRFNSPEFKQVIESETRAESLKI